MPIRMLRDWTQSEKVNQLNANAERFFTRLIMKADDFGCYSANLTLLKSTLYPLLINDVREADITRWMADCQTAGLIVLYEVEGRQYLRIVDFGQRLRTSKSKYPMPDSEPPPPAAKSGLREEKRREEEEKRNVSAQTFGSPPGNFISVKTKYLGDRPAIIYGVKGLIDYMAENQTILNQPEYAEKFLRKYNGQVYNELSHVQNAYRKFIEDQHK